MDNKLAKLLDLVRKIPEDCLDDTIDYVTKIIEEANEEKEGSSCPHCKSANTKRFGHIGSRQRFRCKDCGKTFSEAKNTVMENSHFGEAAWKQVIRDTLTCEPIDVTAASIGACHTTVFNMRHKVLIAMEHEESRQPTALNGVCEIDDTFVLESLKGSKLPDSYWRKPRKHGAVAQKRGISNEYVSICTGIERDGSAVAKTVTRATPGKDDIVSVFGERVGQDALVLCDGAKSYSVLGERCECAVVDVLEETDSEKGGKGFYNINTANSFHSYIKEMLKQYRGVATKYLNRYNTLFANAFRNGSDITDDIYNILCSNSESHYHSINDVKTLNLLDV